MAGEPLRGMADECLSVIGVETSSAGRRRPLRARNGRGILDGWLVDDGDAATVDGVEVRSVPLLMTDPDGDRRDGARRTGTGRRPSEGPDDH